MPAAFSSDLEVQQARTQLETTRAQAIDAEWRAPITSTLCSLKLASLQQTSALPLFPHDNLHLRFRLVYLQNCLSGRPDIAAAERRMASANAQIGVAKARLLSDH